jgi:glycosyltransferase involved in cell wall biosynthesis
MKVLHLISSGGMYGAEAVILNLSKRLQQTGHSSVLGVFENQPHPNLQLHEAAQKQGIESHLLTCEGQFDKTMPQKIRRLVQTTGADVVHAHGYKADIYVYFALRGRKTPLISTCHTWYDNGLILRLYGSADRFFLKRYARVVAVSSEVKDRLLQSGVRPEKVSIIQNGIDRAPFRDAHPSLRGDPRFKDATAIVGLVGRLSTEKGVDVFIRSTSKVLAMHPGLQFVIVGDGPDLESLKALITELNVGANVRLLGRRDDMPSVYRSLDVMVSASRQEGLPMAILEGMASNRALIATSVGGVPSLIKDDVTGILLPPGDVDLLAQAISALVENPQRRQRLGEAAERLIEAEFSAERMTSDYLNLYEKAAAIG